MRVTNENLKTNTHETFIKTVIKTKRACLKRVPKYN